MKMPVLLIVDDEKPTRDALRMGFQDDYEVYTAANLSQAPKEIQEYLIGNMSQNAMHRPGKAYEDFTPAALFLASEDSRWVTGQTLHVEGGAWISA